MNYFGRAFWLGALLVLLSACGFKLRETPLLGASFEQFYVHSTQPHAPLYRAFYQRLQQLPYQLLEQPEVTEPVITLYPERLDRRLLSLFSTGQVAEYELVYQVRYRVTLPNTEPQEFEFELRREYQDDPNAVLAKSREMQIILSEMRDKASERILRQLSKLG
ncbi:LPS-assembly lipoprotein LptE [Saliniradius amylolyticus]|uniref:LPS-assembly lipoprotein LptE n=1 Tax=Saliniradius amylolyticus TaxID=2183582 RepID=A0A2S2E1E2_9ALTE|nr:LPS assembly lipoprotein LptE [Saliniradius amylolyticus]AWL11453.1 LPS-assembly lipoprotein LptE [Saliniradius amylolyticus]